MNRIEGSNPEPSDSEKLNALRSLRNMLIDVEDSWRQDAHDTLSPSRVQHQSPWVKEIQDGSTPSILTREISETCQVWNLKSCQNSFDCALVFLMDDLNIPEILIVLKPNSTVSDEFILASMDSLRKALQESFPRTSHLIIPISNSDDFMGVLKEIRESKQIDYIIDF